MKIHTVKAGETLLDIANEYSVSEEIIKEANMLSGSSPAVGEELLILIPTRSYTVKHGDTPERISIRFGIKKRELYAMNPKLSECFEVGQTIALKYGEKRYGMAASLGILYDGCSTARLNEALPYLTYCAISASLFDGKKLKILFNAEDAIRTLLDNSKIPLLRVYINESEQADSIGCDEFGNMLIDTAHKFGYKGILLSGGERLWGKSYAERLVDLRKKFLGCDLILITEADEGSDIPANEYADGCVLSYSKLHEKTYTDFNEGERKFYSDFACASESSKAFIELPVFGKRNFKSESYMPTSSVLETARRGKYIIETDDNSLISSFTDKRGGKYDYPSLKNIKATLELLSELGFMGIAFDIMRCPRNYLLMYHNLYKTMYSHGE